MSLVGNMLNLNGPWDIQESSQARGPGFRRVLGNQAEDPNVGVIGQGRGEVTVGRLQREGSVQGGVFRKPPESSVKKQSPE